MAHARYPKLGMSTKHMLKNSLWHIALLMSTSTCALCSGHWPSNKARCGTKKQSLTAGRRNNAADTDAASTAALLSRHEHGARCVRCKIYHGTVCVCALQNIPWNSACMRCSIPWNSARMRCNILWNRLVWVSLLQACLVMTRNAHLSITVSDC